MRRSNSHTERMETILAGPSIGCHSRRFIGQAGRLHNSEIRRRNSILPAREMVSWQPASGCGEEVTASGNFHPVTGAPQGTLRVLPPDLAHLPSHTAMH